VAGGCTEEVILFEKGHFGYDEGRGVGLEAAAGVHGMGY
jgi:hypothetical protein